MQAFTVVALQAMSGDELEAAYNAAWHPFTCHNYSKSDKQAVMDEYKRRGLYWPGSRWTVIHYETAVPVTDKEFASEWIANDWLNENVETLDPPDVNAYEIDNIDDIDDE